MPRAMRWSMYGKFTAGTYWGVFSLSFFVVLLLAAAAAAGLAAVAESINCPAKLGEMTFLERALAPPCPVSGNFLILVIAQRKVDCSICRTKPVGCLSPCPDHIHCWLVSNPMQLQQPVRINQASQTRQTDNELSNPHTK